jgi:hypothetical protein
MMRRTLTSLAGFALALSACSGQSTMVGGESVRQPPSPPRSFEIQVFDGDDLTPLSANIDLDGSILTADVNGVVATTWHEEWADVPASLTASVEGFVAESIQLSKYPDQGSIEFRLAPVRLQGQVIGPDGHGLPMVTVRLGDDELQTDARGGFTFVRAVPGLLSLSRPAWQSKTEPWTGDAAGMMVSLEPLVVRALRVGGDAAGDTSAWTELLRLARDTGINAFVVDTKDERGRVLHDTSVALAHEIGAVSEAYNLDQVITDMDALGLYKITRIVTFQDPRLVDFDVSLAAMNSETGRAWETTNGRGWLDPTDPAAWEYSLDLAEEACRRGFDEVQFDYVSFPVNGPVLSLELDDFPHSDYYSNDAQRKRVDTIATFLGTAHDRLNPLGCAVAADVFAITLESSTDEGVGQMPGPLSSAVDVLSPVIYSHLYVAGWSGFDDPNDHAAEIVAAALDGGRQRLVGTAIYRPWVQRAFLDVEEIRGVQEVVELRGLGWMLWSAASDFNAAMLPSE